MQWILLAIIISVFLWKWPKPTLITCGILGIAGLIAVGLFKGPELLAERDREKDREFVSFAIEYTGSGFTETVTNNSDRFLDAATLRTAFSRKGHSGIIASTTTESDLIVAPKESVSTEYIFLRIGQNVIVPDDHGRFFVRAQHPPQVVLETSKQFLGRCIDTAWVTTDEDLERFAESMYVMSPEALDKKCRHVYPQSAVTLRCFVDAVQLR